MNEEEKDIPIVGKLVAGGIITFLLLGGAYTAGREHGRSAARRSVQLVAEPTPAPHPCTIRLGMTTDEVLRACGEPTDRDHTISPLGTGESWFWFSNGFYGHAQHRYVTFRDGYVDYASVSE